MTTPIIITEFLFSNWWKQTEQSTNNHWLDPADERKYCLNQGFKVNTREPRGRTIQLEHHSCSTESEPTARCLRGNNLDPLHVCDSCVVWSICSSPSSGSQNCPSALAAFWEPIPYTGLLRPALIQEVLSLTSTWYSKLGWHPCEACIFLNRNRERVNREGVGGE